jgi:hypothetical protein
MNRCLGVVLATALLVLPQLAQAQTGTITGLLLNDRGTPAVGIRVAAIPAPREGEPVVTTLIGLTQTDTNGRFTLELADPGPYYIMAGELAAPSYYPGVSALSSAKSILLAAGARISGIDFKTAVPLFYVASGRVALPPGHKILPGSRMALAGPVSQEQPIRPDGTFEFSRLTPGRYILKLLPEGSLFATPLVIEDRNITGIAYPNAPIVWVSGSVTMEDSSAAPNVSLAFEDASQNRVMEVATRQSFAFFAPEGEFRASIKSLPNGYQVTSLNADGIDLLSNSSLKFSETRPVVSIAMTVKEIPTVPFAGRAVSPRGIAESVQSIAMKGSGNVEAMQGTVQPDGSFAFDRVAPGDYVATISLSGSNPVKTRVNVPSDGKRDARIVIPESRYLSVRLDIDGSVPAAARPVVTLRFEGNGTVTPIVVDGSSAGVPLRFELRQGTYRVSANVRESTAGATGTRVKTLTSGSVDLLNSPLDVSADNPEIVVSIGR